MSRRILYVVTEDWYFQSHRLPMARAARSVGFEVHVATRLQDAGEAIKSEGFKVHNIAWDRGSLSPADNSRAIAKLRRTIASISPNIVHNVAMKPALLGSIAALGHTNLAVVNSINGLGTLFLARSMSRRMLRAGIEGGLARLMNRPHTRVVVQNMDDFARFEECGVAPGQIVLISGSGVDTERFQVTPEPRGPLRAAFVGRMLEDKGVRCLVAAYDLLRERNISLSLVLAGPTDPANPTSIPVAELQSWNQKSGIEWHGHVDNIVQLWRDMHFAVLPSRREGLPLSLLEAAASGRAMVASDTVGCREIAIEGVTALTHRVDDAEALANALARMTNDGELRAQLGTNARRYVEEKFSAQIIGKETVALYESLLNH